jgi:hypothetical protein
MTACASPKDDAQFLADNIIAGRTDKANIWRGNTEMEYHESK